MAATQKRTRREPRQRSFQSGIKRLAKATAPGLRLSGGAVQQLDRLVAYALARVAQNGQAVLTYKKAGTLDVKVVKAAVGTLFPGELSRSAVKAATGAVVRVADRAREKEAALPEGAEPAEQEA